MNIRIPSNNAFTLWTHPELTPGVRSPLSTAYEPILRGTASIIVTAFGHVAAYFTPVCLTMANNPAKPMFGDYYMGRAAA